MTGAAGPPEPALTVLMPVYNEVHTVEAAIEALHATDLGASCELVVVDDGSTDGTRELLEARDWPPEARLLFHEANRGKGAALRTGLREARGELTAIFDADLEYDPGDLEAVLEPIRNGGADAVFGVRLSSAGTSRSRVYHVGNRAVTLLANLLFRARLKDLMTGHKAMRTELFRGLGLRTRGFEIEAEIAARLLQRDARISEVQVRYQPRASREGKKLKAVDGVRVIATLARCRLGS